MSDQKEKFSEFMSAAGLSTTLERVKIVSINQIFPGSIYTFSYKGNNHIIYVTATKKAVRGSYRAAKTKNLLITGFRLQGIEPDDVGMRLLMKNLFYGKQRPKYKGKLFKTPIASRILVKLSNNLPGDRVPPISTRALLAIAGNDSFRTFIFKNMLNISRYSIKESKVEEE